MFLLTGKVADWEAQMSSNGRAPSDRMIATYIFEDVKVGEDLAAQELELEILIMSESRKIDRIVSNGMELLFDDQ